MGMILMILFAVMEITLVVLTLIKFREKKEWLMLRSIVRASELLVFVLAMLLPHVTFDFKYKICFWILLIRLLRNVFVLIIKRNSAKGQRSKKRTVVASTFATLSLILALIPSLIFAEYEGIEPSGSYKVNTAQAILVDESREESFESDGSKREIPATFYYPEAGDSGEEFPLVIFSHGAFGYSKSNYSTYVELASNGYVVAALDHPYHSFFCKDTDGKTIIVNIPFMNEVMEVNDDNTPENDIYELSSKWLKLRIDDINFVVDAIEEDKAEGSLSDKWFTRDNKAREGVAQALKLTDINNIGLMGHSLGGASSVTVGRNRKDIGAVVDLDGTMLGEQTGFSDGKYSFVEDPYPVPLLVLDSQSHHEQSEYYQLLYVNSYIVDNALEAYRVYMKDSEHMNFTDLPLFSPVLARNLGTGQVDATYCIKTVNSLVLDFMNYTLKGEGTFNPSECY